MADGLTINSSRFEQAVHRYALTSKKSAVDVMKQQAKLVFANVAKYTPPASQGVIGKAAEKQGKAKIAADIRSLYGTAGDAFDALEAVAPETASTFWFLHRQGDDDLAGDLVRQATGKSFAPFDGGTLHDRTGGGSRRRARRNREHVFYVRDERELAAYIAAEQENVWWLAGGWASALTALQAKLPYGVDKQNSPGSLEVRITDGQIVITMKNAVSFGRQVRGIERRIQWAMNVQTQRLNRQWNYYSERAAKQAGFR